MSKNLGIAILLGVAIAAGCRDLPQAPNAPPPVVDPSPFWSFRLDHEFYVDYGAGFARPTVLLEGSSTINVVYGDFDQGTVKYAGCASYCSDTAYWHVGVVDSSGYDPATVLTATGLHAVYSRAELLPDLTLEYTYCPGSCMLGNHWSRVAIDTTSYPVSAAIAADPSGGLHVVYGDRTGYRVRYAECPDNCLASGSWVATDLAHVRLPIAVNVGEKHADIAVDAAGMVHLVYSMPAEGVLRYAACAAACTNAGSWTVADIDSAGTIFSTAMTLDSAGALNVAYLAGPTFAGPWSLRLARCATACTSVAAWARGTVSTDAGWEGQQDVAISPGPGGTLHLAFLLAPDSTTLGGSRDVAYATCRAACTDSSSWERQGLGRAYTQSVAIAVDPLGKPRFTSVSWGSFWFIAMK